MMHSEALVNMESWAFFVKGKFRKEVWITLFFNILRTIWYERNEVRFNRKSFNLLICVEAVKLRLGH